MIHDELKYTEISNDLIDNQMKNMSPSELKVILAAIYSIGIGQSAISLTRFQELTGLTRPSVISGINGALERGLLKVVGQNKDRTNVYELVNKEPVS